MDRDKILKMVAILAAIVVVAGGLSKYLRRDSISLAEYARLHGVQASASPGPPSQSPAASPSPEETGNSPEPTFKPDPGGQGQAGTETASPGAGSQEGILPGAGSTEDAPPGAGSTEDMPPGHGSPEDMPPRAGSTEDAPPGAGSPEDMPLASTALTGASLNGSSQLEERVLLEEGFYYEPLSTQLRRFITGISFPAPEADTGSTPPEVTLDELRYVHILHYDFEGNPTEGELICNEFIAQDLVEIFYALYQNEYQLEKVLLIDEYEGDDNASMEDNNTSCFNYRQVEGSTRLSRHAFGLAIDINPLYNPYITYTEDGGESILPASASAYADRSLSFPYKIDENDLCYKLFIQHGFTWGGNWNNAKDYQHFQKTKP